MNRKKIIFIFLAICQFSFCRSQINITNYLTPKENTTFRYNCFFINAEKDTVKEITELIFKSFYMTSEDNQGISREESNHTYNNSQFTNNKIYHLENKSEGKSYGSNHFLFSAMAVINGELVLAPYYFPDELNELKAESFINTIPKFVEAKDTIKIVDGNRTTLLYGFKMENIEVPTSPGKVPCLKIEQEDRWPKTIYHAQIWASLDYGIVKWIRTTGRTETLIFE